MADDGTSPGEGQAKHRDSSTSLDPLMDLPLVVESGGRLGLLISLSILPSIGGCGTLGISPSKRLAWVMFQNSCLFSMELYHSNYQEHYLFSGTHDILAFMKYRIQTVYQNALPLDMKGLLY